MKKVLIGILCLCVFAHNSFASETQEKMYLMQIVNQLDAVQPLILAAQKNQPQNTRQKFHYQKYQDNNGHWHNGLLEDVQAIKKGILEKLDNTAIEPRVIAPLQGDYISK